METPVLTVKRAGDLTVVYAEWPDATLAHAVSEYERRMFRGDLSVVVYRRMLALADKGEAGSPDRAESLRRADWLPVVDTLLPPAEPPA
jgi:hypothetical protein